MSIELYEHNQRAYEVLCAMLEKARRAAVVHPTGTGKSFIAFKYAQEHPQQRILWLAPSEYIFSVQLQSVHRAAPGIQLDRICFMTYAKLMLQDEAELIYLTPDVIILDEFHRCGAEHWGEGVRRLLACAPDALVLGLSATSIRYLDNQRDMAQELFDGNIASEMTLGEAIVRGILPAPRYVTTVFQYQKELRTYEKRIKAGRSVTRRTHEEKLLQALRRALEKADGLEDVFARHMQEKNGKYIVFCANLEHMREMMNCVPQWFYKVDPKPNCYAVFAENPEASKVFRQFQEDESDHLKLLFSIDMLNEGIHIPDVSGVILFRPTISPTVYMQQIGRALTTGDKRVPLIIDVVNNIENLLSIGALESDMQEAAQRMRENGEGQAIVTERFDVIDQVQDVRELFGQLRNSLQSEWEQYFEHASAYAQTYGNLLVPKNYIVQDGLNLGQWIGIQRKVRAGLQAGRLTEQQIARLDGIGMIWNNRLETAWERGFAHAQSYAKAHGNLLVPVRYVTPDGYPLGKWIYNIRQRVLNGEQQNILTQERVARLNAIGMKWDVLSVKWEENFQEAEAYYREHGDLLVPGGYKTESGFALGMWIRNLRSARLGKESGRRELTAEQIERLNAIGMVWESSFDGQWMRAYKAAKAFYLNHGHLNITVNYISPEGIALGKWIRRQRDAQCGKKGLSDERKAMLEKIGIVWKSQKTLKKGA